MVHQAMLIAMVVGGAMLVLAGAAAGARSQAWRSFRAAAVGLGAATLAAGGLLFMQTRPPELALEWWNGTAELTGLFSGLSRGDQLTLAQGGDASDYLYAIHVRLSNAGHGAAFVTLDGIHLALGSRDLPLRHVDDDSRFLHPGILPPGGTVEGILVFLAPDGIDRTLAERGRVRYDDGMLSATGLERSQ
jgi:hypothetical protein